MVNSGANSGVSSGTSPKIQPEKKRKGASKVSDVQADILIQLENGTMESATLSEGLVIDFTTLLASVFPELAATAKREIDAKAGITKRMAAVAKLILQSKGDKALPILSGHASDTVRGWACYLIAGLPGITLSEKLEHIMPLADDHHFGVREWAWLALRPDIVKSPEESIALLQPWTTHLSANIRRFAVEAVRPRGVWSAHIGILKQSPEIARPLLEPLKSDPSRYVQDSIANWLNDAYKSQPDWVQELCNTWEKKPSPQTAYIIKRALRSKK